MKHRTLLASLLILPYFGSVICNLFTKVELGPIKDDDTIHGCLSGENDIRIQDAFWDSVHDNSWKSLTTTAHWRATPTKNQMQDSVPNQADRGLKALLSMVDKINRVFIPNAAPEHRHVVEDLKVQLAQHASKVLGQHWPYQNTLIVDETVQHILKSALAFNIFQTHTYLRDRAATGQSQYRLSAAFLTSKPAHIYAGGYLASIGFLNMVEHLVMDGLRDEGLFRQFSLREDASIPSKRQLAANQVTSRIVHQNSVLTWWKCRLSTKDPYYYMSRNEVTAEKIKKKLRGIEFIGTQNHMNIWKRLVGVAETSRLSKKKNEDISSLLKIYPTAKFFFRRLMDNDNKHDSEILEELCEILEIFDSCHDHRDRRTLKLL
ncbi:uncharacterized protein MELLADRAFT_124329, partial [Melampsora larici-populina 98AG31]